MHIYIDTDSQYNNKDKSKHQPVIFNKVRTLHGVRSKCLTQADLRRNSMYTHNGM